MNVSDMACQRVIRHFVFPRLLFFTLTKVLATVDTPVMQVS